MPLDTPDNIVAAGVEAYAKAELKVRQAQKAIMDVIPIIEAGNQQLMMGNLQTQKMIADLKEAAGKVAAGEALVWRSHIEATDIAKANGVDIVTTDGGGPR